MKALLHFLLAVQAALALAQPATAHGHFPLPEPHCHSNAGQLKTKTEANGKKTHYAYNSRGQPTHIWGDVPYPQEMVYNDYGEMGKGSVLTIDTFTTALWHRSSQSAEASFGLCAVRGAQPPRLLPWAPLPTALHGQRGRWPSHARRVRSPFPSPHFHGVRPGPGRHGARPIFLHHHPA